MENLSNFKISRRFSKFLGKLRKDLRLWSKKMVVESPISARIGTNRRHARYYSVSLIKMSSSRIPMRESLFIREQLNHLANFNGLNTVERSLHGWFLAPFLDRRGDLPFRLPCLSSSFRFSILPWNHPFRRGLINRSVVYSPSDHHRYDPFLGSKGKIPILFYDASNPANLRDPMANVDEFT